MASNVCLEVETLPLPRTRAALELVPPLAVEDHPTLEERAQGKSRRQEALVVEVESLISGPPVRCASSLNPWRGRSPGSCRWRSWEPSPLPGSDDRVCKATGNSNRWYCGARGCSPWVSSLVSRASSTSIT